MRIQFRKLEGMRNVEDPRRFSPVGFLCSTLVGIHCVNSSMIKYIMKNTHSCMCTEMNGETMSKHDEYGTHCLSYTSVKGL